MITDKEALEMILNGHYENLYFGMQDTSISMIKDRIQEIPSEFFEPNINIDKDGRKKVSLIQFSAEIAGMPAERQKGMMEKYKINPYDMKKLQAIIDSIRVVREYGSVKMREEQEKSTPNEEHVYGFSLASNDKISKAYPLWLAYLFADSKNPMVDISAKLKEDGMEDKYDPKTIVKLIEHTNSLMEGKSEEEKKDFYVKSIGGILDEEIETEIPQAIEF